MAVLLHFLFLISINAVYSINPPICNSIEFEWDCGTGYCRYQSTQPVNVCAGSRSAGVGHSTMYYCHNNRVWRKQWDSSANCQGAPYKNELMSDVIERSNFFGPYVEECNLQLCNYVKISVFSATYPSQGQCGRQGSDAGDYYDEMHINGYCIGLNDYMGGTQDYSLRWDCSAYQILQNSWIGVSDCSTSYDVLYSSSVGNGICVPLYAYEYKNIECATATPFPTTAPLNPTSAASHKPVTSQSTAFPTTAPSNKPVTSKSISSRMEALPASSSAPTASPFISNGFVNTSKEEPKEPQTEFQGVNHVVWVIAVCIGCCLLLSGMACVYKNKSGYSVVKKMSVSSIKMSTNGITTPGSLDGTTTKTMGEASGSAVFGEGGDNDNDMDGNETIMVPIGSMDEIDDGNDTNVVPVNETYRGNDTNVLPPGDNEGIA